MESLCNIVSRFGPLIGRILLAYIFIRSGYGKIGNFAGTAGYMASKELPFTEVLLAATILIELGGGILLVLGWQTRWAALVIFLWLIPTTLIFHPYWTFEAEQVSTQMIQFSKNLAIMGGMLYVVAFGAGPLSLDARKT